MLPSYAPCDKSPISQIFWLTHAYKPVALTAAKWNSVFMTVWGVNFNRGQKRERHALSSYHCRRFGSYSERIRSLKCPCFTELLTGTFLPTVTLTETRHSQHWPSTTTLTTCKAFWLWKSDVARPVRAHEHREERSYRIHIYCLFSCVPYDMAFLTVSQVFLSMQVYNQYNYCFLNTTQGSEFVLQFHWPSNNVFRFQELSSRLLTLFPRAGPWSAWAWQPPSPRHPVRTQAPLLVETSSGGKALTGFLQNLHFLPFSLMCFLCHHHETILTLQMKYFITKRQKQKKLRGSCTGWHTSSVPPTGITLRAKAPSLVCRWPHPKLHLLSPNCVHCVSD